MILVTGATGTVGRELVAKLASRGGKVRALSRRRDLPGRRGDRVRRPRQPRDPRPGAGRRRAGVRPGHGACRLAHEINLVAAARQAGAVGLVKLSALTVEDETTEDIITRWHRAAEQAVTGSGLSWTILRPGAFMSNTLAWAGMIKHQGQVFAPFGQARTAAIDPADIAAAAATALLQDGHDGRTYPLTGPELISARDQADVLSAALGRQLGFTEIPAGAARQRMIQAGLPDQVADAVLATQASAGTGPAAEIRPVVQQLTGRPARTYRDWVIRHLAAFR